MNNLEPTVEYYLKSKTDYALLVTGPWGSGKTYYFKNRIQPLISTIPLRTGGEKHYRSILISLYGLNSIQDIQTQIFYETYPILNNKAVKYTVNVARVIGKNFLKIKEEDYGKAIDELMKSAGEAIGEGDLVKQLPLVICFDDLERRGTNLSLSELFGFVNSLTQDVGAKVILIANEDEDIHKSDFRTKKEKVVGLSIEFIPDLKELITSVIESRYSNVGSLLFSEYLLSNIDFFVDYLKGKTLNLRTLVFALDYFQNIYSKIDLQFEEEEHILMRIKADALKFTLAISIEYREGKLVYRDINQLKLSDIADIKLDKNFITNVTKKNTPVVKEGEVDYREIFKLKYYEGEDYVFFDSLFYYITTANFNYIDSDLIPELKKKYGLKKDIDTPDYTHVYNVLSSNSVHTLPDSIYILYVRKLVKYLESGVYEYLHMYYKGYLLIMSLNNFLNYDEEKISKRISKGVRKANILDYAHTYDLEFSEDVINNSAPLNELIGVILDANRNVMLRIRKQDIGLIIKSFDEDDFNVFTKLIHEKTLSWSYGYLKDIPMSKILKALKTRDINFIMSFSKFVRGRYSHDSIHKLGESDFMKNLLYRLQNLKTTKRRGVALAWVMTSIQKTLARPNEEMY